MLILYRLLSYLALPLIAVHLVLKCLKDPAYRARIPERFGFSKKCQAGKTIWFHAVSAGEVIAIAPSIERLSKEINGVHLIVTTTTPTGSAEVRRRLGDLVVHTYAPYDLPGAIKRFLRRCRPTMLVLVETELWPNTIDILYKRDIPIYLINARLSQKSADQYAIIKSLTQSMLRRIRGISCQYQDTADRFMALGAHKNQISVTGSVKFDLEIASEIDEKTQSLKADWCRDRVAWIAASTHPSEEEVVLQAHRSLLEERPDLLLILVPRHPPRTDEVLNLCKSFELSYRKISESPSSVQVVVVDQMGLLLPLYGLSRVAFVGGSLQGTGGHNPIEPAYQEIPILMGPDRHNFQEICRRFEEAGGLQIVENAEELAEAVSTLIQDEALSSRRTQAAKQVILTNQGASKRLHADLVSWIEPLNVPMRS